MSRYLRIGRFHKISPYEFFYQGIDDSETIITMGPMPFFYVNNPISITGRFVISMTIPNSQKKIWDNQSFFYVEIPKTGSCSIRWSCNQKYTFGHMYARFYPKHIKHKLRTIVRNPYDRLVSAYFFMYNGGFGNNDIYTSFKTKYKNFEEWVLYGLEKHHTRYSKSFVHHTPEGSLINGWAEPLILQSEFFCASDGKLLLKRINIGRYENINEDAKRLFGIDSLLHYNRSPNKLDYRSYYTNKEVLEKVYKLYRRDFELFGYSKEL